VLYCSVLFWHPNNTLHSTASPHSSHLSSVTSLSLSLHNSYVCSSSFSPLPLSCARWWPVGCVMVVVEEGVLMFIVVPSFALPRCFPSFTSNSLYLCLSVFHHLFFSVFLLLHCSPPCFFLGHSRFLLSSCHPWIYGFLLSICVAASCATDLN